LRHVSQSRRIDGFGTLPTPGLQFVKSQRTTEIAKQLAAEGFTAVDYDRRGRDKSGDTPPWSLGREVEDVAALIEAAGAPAALYTSSSGAGIALADSGAGCDGACSI
jgi:alpha-beta hydrolase superfamily lysophospholipase